MSQASLLRCAGWGAAIQGIVSDMAAGGDGIIKTQARRRPGSRLHLRRQAAVERLQDVDRFVSRHPGAR